MSRIPEHLRNCPSGMHLATPVGGFRLVRYCGITDKYQIVWDSHPYDVAYMDGGALTSFMAVLD